MNNERADILLGEAERCLERYKVSLESGDVVDFTDFEKIAVDFCADVSRMPPDKARRYSNSMKYMIDSLRLLRERLDKQLDDIKRQIGTLNESSHAHSAYKNSTSSQ